MFNFKKKTHQDEKTWDTIFELIEREKQEKTKCKKRKRVTNYVPLEENYSNVKKSRGFFHHYGPSAKKNLRLDNIIVCQDDDDKIHTNVVVNDDCRVIMKKLKKDHLSITSLHGQQYLSWDKIYSPSTVGVLGGEKNEMAALQIYRWLNQFNGNDSCINNLIVTGESGCGKTSICRWLAELFEYKIVVCKPFMMELDELYRMVQSFSNHGDTPMFHLSRDNDGHKQRSLLMIEHSNILLKKLSRSKKTNWFIDNVVRVSKIPIIMLFDWNAHTGNTSLNGDDRPNRKLKSISEHVYFHKYCAHDDDPGKQMMQEIMLNYWNELKMMSPPSSDYYPYFTPNLERMEKIVQKAISNSYGGQIRKIIQNLQLFGGYYLRKNTLHGGGVGGCNYHQFDSAHNNDNLERFWQNYGHLSSFHACAQLFQNDNDGGCDQEMIMNSLCFGSFLKKFIIECETKSPDSYIGPLDQSLLYFYGKFPQNQGGVKFNASDLLMLPRNITTVQKYNQTFSKIYQTIKNVDGQLPTIFQSGNIQRISAQYQVMNFSTNGRQRFRKDLIPIMGNCLSANSERVWNFCNQRTINNGGGGDKAKKNKLLRHRKFLTNAVFKEAKIRSRANSLLRKQYK